MKRTQGNSTSVPVAVQPIVKIPTGIRGLDAILDGGLPRGRMTVLAGGPGSGKTVLALEFLYRGALAGEPGIFITFEEAAEDLRANAAAMGMDVAPLEASGMLRIMHAKVPHQAIHAGEFDLQGLLAILDGQFRSVESGRIVLDAVDVLMRIFGDPRRERVELHVLNDWLRARGATSVVTAKAGREGRQIYPFLDFMSDCVLLIDQRMEGQVRTRRLSVMKYRGSGFLENEHPFAISPRGVVLLPVASTALSDRRIDRRISSGHEQLDVLLGGGYLQGSCILLAGPSGAGKTTLACTFVERACRRGERVLYLCLDEAHQSLLVEMKNEGIDLEPAAHAGTIAFQDIMPETDGVEQHLLKILDAIEEFEPHHVIVDSISAVQRMGTRSAAFDFLLRLLAESKRRGITCFFTNQILDLERVTGDGGEGVSSLVDTMVGLQYEDDGRRLRRRLLVIKSRGTGHSMLYHRFEITGHGIELADDDRSRKGEEDGDR